MGNSGKDLHPPLAHDPEKSSFCPIVSVPIFFQMAWVILFINIFFKKNRIRQGVINAEKGVSIFQFFVWELPASHQPPFFEDDLGHQCINDGPKMESDRRVRPL